MLKEHPLLVFFPLAFLLSWYPYVLGKTHLVKTSGGMNPLGVMVAAIVAAAVCYGGQGVKQTPWPILPLAHWMEQLRHCPAPACVPGQPLCPAEPAVRRIAPDWSTVGVVA